MLWRTMSADPLVSCGGCRYTWHSASMAEGLRLLGGCPRCGGELQFAQTAEAAAPAESPVREPEVTADAPHRVLGVPRR
jgi:hypothetical protein